MNTKAETTNNKKEADGSVQIDRIVMRFDPIFFKWRNKLLEEAKTNKEHFFLGLPDSWFKSTGWKGHFGCVNLHLSTCTLKTHKGMLCMECMQPVYVVPDSIKNDNELIKEVNA